MRSLSLFSISLNQSLKLSNMTNVLKVDLYYIYRLKVSIDFYGPSPMRIETISIVSKSYDDALAFISKLYKNLHELYSVELIDKSECVVL